MSLRKILKGIDGFISTLSEQKGLPTAGLMDWRKAFV